MKNSKRNNLEQKLNQCVADLETTEKMFSSLYEIGIMGTKSYSINKILSEIVRKTQCTFDFTRVAIILLDKNKKTLKCEYWVGFSPEQEKKARSRPLELERHICRETIVAKTGKTIIIKDVQDPRNTELDIKMDKLYCRKSTITAPLKIKKEIIGVLAADRTSRTLHMKKNEIKLFTTFANQASIIIENARLQGQNKRKIDQLISIQKFNKQMAETLNLKNLASLIVKSVREMTRGQVVAFLLKIDGEPCMKIVSHKGCDALNPKKFRLKIGEGVAGFVAEKSVPLLINDVQQEPRYKEFLKGLRSELAIPLNTKNKSIGVLVIGSYETDAFIEEDMEILMIFARKSAIMLENARLYEEIIVRRNFAENILESSPNGIIAIGFNGKICSINREAERIFEVDRKTAIGRNVTEILSDEIVHIAEMGLKNGDIAEDWEIEAENGGGRKLILMVTSSLMNDQGCKVANVIINVRDLTDIKRTEEAIKRMDRLSSLGELSAGLSHEIRNPLASIALNVQMLSKMIDRDDKIRSIVNDTITGVNRIKRLVKGIHDFAKPGIPSLQSGCINDVIMDSISLLDSQLKKRKIDMHIDLDETVSPIVFDPLKIQQVFINLLINAMDALPSGGMVKITSMIEHHSPKNGSVLAVSVADNGTGIPPENIPKIFDPFFTTKPEGTGLGLSITHKILEQHRAIINIDSVENAGTIFIIRFPIDTKMEDNVPI